MKVMKSFIIFSSFVHNITVLCKPLPMSQTWLALTLNLRKLEKFSFFTGEKMKVRFNLKNLSQKGERTLSHCAWARTFDLVIRWQI
jgi:hypothetical protein